MTTAEVARDLGVSEVRVRRLVMEGILPALRPGARPLRFLSEQVAMVQYRRLPDVEKAQIRSAAARYLNLHEN